LPTPATKARALAHFLEREPGRTVAIVTTTVHTRRARAIFRRVLGDEVRLRFVGAPTEGYDDSNWWRHEGGVGICLAEYAKLVLSR